MYVCMYLYIWHVCVMCMYVVRIHVCIFGVYLCVWCVWMHVFGMYVSMYLGVPGLTCGMWDLLVVACGT